MSDLPKSMLVLIVLAETSIPTLDCKTLLLIVSLVTEMVA